MQVIFHLDLDSYFVSAHRTVDQSLIDKCIVISSGGNRSIVTAASYEAKNKGIHVPMPLYKAKQLVPNLLVIKPNYALYTNLSSKVFEFITSKYTSEIEVASIDECYINVTQIAQTPQQAIKLAKKMQKEILDKLKLPCSIGISTNKFVAKMSTQINKPFGISLTKEKDFLNIFGSWKIINFHGIGKPTANKLNLINIFTIKDLANANARNLKSIFGNNAQNFIKKANGHDNSVVDSKMNDLKTIGNSVTFQDYDKSSRKEILKILSNLTKIVAIRAHNRNMIGSVVQVSIKNKGSKDIKSISKQKTLIRPIYTYEDIFQVGSYLFDNLWEGQTIKFIGISLSKLQNKYESTYQSSIFDKPKKDNKIEKIIKNINHKFKYKAIYLGNEQIDKNNKENKQTRYLESDRILKHYDKK